MSRIRLKPLVQTPMDYGMPVPSRGILIEWNDEQGYGFISPEAGEPKVFLHIKSLRPGSRRPMVGDDFFYKLTKDGKGRPRAEEAYQAMLNEKRDTPFYHSILKVLSSVWPLAFVPAFVVTAKTSKLILGIYAAFIVNSLLTFLFYWEDKYLAQYKYWRIPEKRLHIWELLCGWPGALFAQRIFKHKRSKGSFMIVFWFCAIANVTALFLLFHYGNPRDIGEAIGSWWQDFASLYE
ncbi:MAG: cold shock and DUF1294 domain-containing protein [Victivallales bacterium]|nr:cold shock and DUF1294 domain-containing protein [Victivallales bacterium]